MNEDFLAHYGVLGMKWGRRKQKASSSSRTLSRKEQKAQKTKNKIINKQKKVLERNKKVYEGSLDTYNKEKSLGLNKFLKKYQVDTSVVDNPKKLYKDSLNYLYDDLKIDKDNFKRSEDILKAYSNMKVKNLTSRQVKKKAKKIKNDLWFN